MDQELEAMTAQRREVLDKLVSCLKENLNIAYPSEVIHSDATLFGSGLGLDSIDALEVVMVVEKEFGVSLDEANMESMRTLNTLTDSIIGLKTTVH